MDSLDSISQGCIVMVVSCTSNWPLSSRLGRMAVDRTCCMCRSRSLSAVPARNPEQSSPKGKRISVHSSTPSNPFRTTQRKSTESHHSPLYKCGTSKLSNAKFKILTTPSPSINPLANTTTGVSSLPLQTLQYQFTNPPAALANVKLGTLYIPTATAIPPGTHACHHLPCPRTRSAVSKVKRIPAPRAHCQAMGGRPLPVTRRAVNIQTWAVGTWNWSPGTV